VITLQVTDSHGMSSQATRSITIAEEDTPEALNLVLAPFAIGEVIPYGGAPVQQAFTLHSSGDTEMSWTATEAVPWLSLSAASGQTPSDLTLTINPAGLHVGLHYGKITFTSAQAGNSPIEMAVTLEVTGYGLKLPVIRSP
jgi:hypothetical protein